MSIACPCGNEANGSVRPCDDAVRRQPIALGKPS